jgi:hypothetical protein
MTTTVLPNNFPGAHAVCPQSVDGPPPALVTCLSSLVAASGIESVGISSGEIEGIPGPVSGAGLPGLVAACVGLLFLGQRRRRQLTAA